MLAFVDILPHIRWKQLKASPCKRFTFHGYDWVVYFSLPEHDVVHWCLGIWDVGTGEKNILHFMEVFRRHLLWDHVPRVVPKGCAKGVEVLTDRIVKTHAYPSAYGGFSDVWSCQLRYEQGSPKKVAVKAIRPVFANKEEFHVKQKAVKQELGVWAGLKHQNVLPLYGVTFGFGRLPAFVCPWADNGTLSEYLEKFETRLDMKKRIMLLGDIAAGLQYLHSCDLVHGDLSGSNILITKSGRACLSDFGLSTLVNVSDAKVSDIPLPCNIRWAAPELLGWGKEGTSVSQLSSQQADIYSFGSVTLQILSGKIPFHGIRRVAQIVILISRGYKPPREPGWDGRAIPDVLWEFVQSCWASPSQRPSCKEIVRFIGNRLSSL